MLTGGDKICQNLADVICERSLTQDMNGPLFVLVHLLHGYENL